MSKTKSKRWANGLTIIELVTTIVILGIIMVGLGLSLRTVTYHYQDDSVLLDIHNYGNTVMREIMKEISLARIINKEQVNGYSRISLKKYDVWDFQRRIDHPYSLSRSKLTKFETFMILFNLKALMKM